MRRCSRRCSTFRCPPERAPKLAPEELRRRQLAAMVAWLLAGARTQPIVLAFEDLHWADPTTLDLLKSARRARRAGAAADRRDGAARIPRALGDALAPRRRFRSRRSTARRFARMVGAIAARHALSQGRRRGRERSHRRRAAVRRGGDAAAARTRRAGRRARRSRRRCNNRSPRASIGSAKAREVAQIGAVLGREFLAMRCCSAVAGTGRRRRCEAALERLAEADMLFVEGVAPQATYRFKHALIQDAAYESLLKSRRQALHRRAAEALLRPRRRRSRSSSRIISRKPARTIWRSNGGVRQATRALKRSGVQGGNFSSRQRR